MIKHQRDLIGEKLKLIIFAASLLMPKDLLNKEINKLIQKNSRNYLSEYNVHELADIFEVSTISMSIRLSRLGFI